VKRLRIYLEMIQFPHTVFALPFAFTGAVLAAGGIPAWDTLLWITVAMVGARSGAMGLNRVIDAEYDRLNPRTATRAIPMGLLSRAQVLGFSVVSLGFLVLAAAQLNPLCLALSPVAIAVVVLYSYTKRFTALSHLVLGLALALAPVGAWLAVTGSFSLAPLVLGASVLFWVAGFDILYALQDLDFDRKMGLYSIPARVGVRRALLIARVFHAFTVAGLLAVGHLLGRGGLYTVGVLAVAGLLAYEHSLVKPGDLSRLDTAFFNMNGAISLTVFAFTLADVWLVA